MPTSTPRHIRRYLSNGSTNITYRVEEAANLLACSPAANSGPSSASSIYTATTKARLPGCARSTSYRFLARSLRGFEQTRRRQAKATSTSHRNKVQKEQTDLKKKQAELILFEEKLKHAADQKDQPRSR